MKKANKLLLVLPRKSSFFIPMTVSLKNLGFKTIHFDYLKPNFSARLLGVVTNALPKSSTFHPLFIRYANNQLVAFAKKIKPDYMLVIKGEIITPQTIKIIKNIGTTTINWFPDNDSLWELLIKTAPYYNHYFSVCKYLTRKLNRKGIKTYYLPVADLADDKLRFAKKRYNLVFAGHKTDKRVKYFSAICKLGFDLWGYKHWSKTLLSPYYHGELSVNKLKNIYRQAKIVINVSTGEGDTPINIANLRNFEATGVGAFVLSEYNTAVAELFVENKEMVFFRSVDELYKKAKYYLKHPREREMIARAGWKKTKTYHTYKNRFNSIFSKIFQL